MTTTNLKDPYQPKTLPGLLCHWAAVNPDGVAMREKELGVWKGISWRDYEEQVRRFALGLQKMGIKRGECVAIAGDDVHEWLIADLAVQSLGCVSIGIYPTNPWPELQYIVRHSRCRMVVCMDQEQVDKVLDASNNGGGLPLVERIVCVDMKGMRRYSDPRLVSFEATCAMCDAEDQAQARERWRRGVDAVTPSDICIIVYTSGTTGPPKGAQLTHNNIYYSAFQYSRLHGLNERNYSVLCYLPLCHLAERLFSVAMHLHTGGVVNFAESIDTVQANIREIGPTLFLGVPRIWEKMQQGVLIKSQESSRLQRWIFEAAFARAYKRLVRRDEQRQPSGAPSPMGWLEKIEYAVLWLLVFRSVTKHLGLDHSLVRICGAAPVSPETLRFFEVLGLPIYQVYGLTEGGMSFCQHPGARMNGCAGQPMAGIESKLGDDGEVLIKGPTVFSGYLFDAEGTRNVLDDSGWLHTGDIAELAPNGEVRIVDRKKAIIITSGGKNIAPSEIENALRESVYIREAVVIGDGRHFLSALIQIDLDSVGNWASARQLAYTNYKSLSQLPAVRELIGAEVERANERFARVEKVRKFLILSKELDHDDGELTATQKVKRKSVEKKFSKEIADMYEVA